MQALREHHQRQQVRKAFAAERWQDHDLIFPCSVDTPGDSSNLRKDYYRVLQKAGLPKIRFHDLRHTAASLMLNNGVPVIVVSRVLGHSKPSVTLDIYGHLLLDVQAEAARVMDRLVRPIPIDMDDFRRSCKLDEGEFADLESESSAPNCTKLHQTAPELTRLS